MDAGQRRLLPTMPLHTITAQLGTAGLLERFAMEIAGFPAPDRQRAQRALDLAARLHEADRRQTEPYLNHLLRVAIRIIRYYRVEDPDVVCAALLHDAVEDHAAELAAALADGGPADSGPPDSGPADSGPPDSGPPDSGPPDSGPPDSGPPDSGPADSGPADDGAQAAALAGLASGFGSRVAEMVAAVTNPDYELGRSAHEQYREHVAASLEDSPWARVIKASDFTDNGVGLIYSSGPAVPRLAAKYAPLVPVLAELIARPDTPLDDEVKAHILRQLDQARQRFAAVRAGSASSGVRS